MKTFIKYFSIVTLLTTGLVLPGPPSLGQTIRYVTPTGTGDGSSWANASGNLRATLLASSVGNQVWVATGTYKPTTSTDRALSFSIPSGVQVYGGFAGTETNLSQRRLSYPLTTVLSGAIGAVTVEDNTYHVVIFQDAATNTLLDGIVIRDGWLNNSYITPNGQAGCGILNLSNPGQISSPTLRYCHITNNGGPQVSGAGGLFNQDGNVTLINCLITSNSGEFCGGVSSTPTGTVTAVNCTFYGNSSRMSPPSGAADIRGGRLLMTNSIVWGHPLIPDSSQPTYPGRWINELVAGSSITYSYIQGRVDYAGTGTIWSYDVNPGLNPQLTPDYRLQATSPAINTGDPAGTGLSPTDLAGNVRVAGGRVDMGAFEFGSAPPPTTTLTLLTPDYNCSSGAFHFNTSGGDGSPIEYFAIGITGWTTDPNRFVDRETRTACDAGPITLYARYVGRPTSEVNSVWNIRAVCPACGSTPPSPPVTGLTLLTPNYDCSSGAFHFNTSGGDGSPIEYFAIGITGWTTDPNRFVDRETRTACDAGPITLYARYVGRPTSEVNLVWNIRAVCPACGGSARLGTSTEGSETGLVVRILGNPITGERVAVEIRGATDQSLRLKTTDIRGRVIEETFVKEASSHEQHWLKTGSSAGLYFLQVTTPRQTRTVKVIKE